MLGLDAYGEKTLLKISFGVPQMHKDFQLPQVPDPTHPK